MSTFVSVTQDMNCMVSSVTIGEWLLQIYGCLKPECVVDYFGHFSQRFKALSFHGNEKDDFVALFDLLLDQCDIVFEFLNVTKEKGELVIENTDSNSNPSRKSHRDALREAEEFFIVLMVLISTRIENVRKQGECTGKLLGILTSGTDMSEFRLKLLQILFNVLPNNFPYRYATFKKLLKYASETHQFESLLPYLKYFQKWFSTWVISIQNLRFLYSLIYQELLKLGKVEQGYEFLKLHVESFTGESQEILEQKETMDVALTMALDSIKLPSIVYFDSILELDAIKMLQNTEHKDIYKLLCIYLNGGPKDLQTFFSEQSTLIEKYGFNYEDCLRKIRLLALASVSEGKARLGLNEIAKELQLQEEQVESVVVDAIGQGLFDAKVDQINQIVYFRSSLEREFNHRQWEKLHSRLKDWYDNTRSILSLVLESKFSIN